LQRPPTPCRRLNRSLGSPVNFKGSGGWVSLLPYPSIFFPTHLFPLLLFWQRLIGMVSAQFAWASHILWWDSCRSGGERINLLNVTKRLARQARNMSRAAQPYYMQPIDKNKAVKGKG